MKWHPGSEPDWYESQQVKDMRVDEQWWQQGKREEQQQGPG